ncbi:MAG TPA: hypothetical protein VJO99_20010 [Burkholderiaceae bacterium]|nr:hypothetical protein [Burkholderiaceae bacterium]
MPPLATLTPLAIVTQDQVALRAAPRDGAAQQAVLWQGDVLEVRGEKLGYLQVYDHRRERAGYVLASQVRGTALAADEAQSLLAVLRFVRDTPGAEALGIAYAAAYLRAVPADAITAEPFDALASMAERLAQRASVRQVNARSSDALAAHLEVARSYGVQFTSLEHDGTIRLCYDGDAYRRVFALTASAEQRARAALALTRHDCMDPDLRPLARTQLDAWRAEVLDRLDTAQWQQLAAPLKNRLRLRRAGVWSAIAFERSRQGDAVGAAAAAQRAIGDLAAIDKNELADGDAAAYTDAALRVGAVRWAAIPVPDTAATVAASTNSGRNITRSRPTIVTAPGQPGETCALLVDASHGADAPLAKRCSYGVIWAASASTRADGRAVALAVQPLVGWRELWVFRRDGSSGNAWSVAVLPPAASNPELGSVEFAGWVPGSDKLLLAREARVDGRYKRSFEVANLTTLNTEKQASAPAQLALFNKWQDPGWKRSTVMLR